MDKAIRQATASAQSGNKIQIKVTRAEELAKIINSLQHNIKGLILFPFGVTKIQVKLTTQEISLEVQGSEHSALNGVAPSGTTGRAESPSEEKTRNG